MRFRKLSKFILLLSLVSTMGVVTWGCREKQNVVAMPARPPASVSVIAAAAKDVPLYLDEIGRTTAVESVTIQPQVTGKVMDIHFSDGAMLKKGELLFTIDPRPFQATLDQAQATLAADIANVKWAESEYKRVVGLRGTGAVSQSDVENKQNAVEVAQAQTKSVQAAIEKAKLDLEYCTIPSPIDGRAGHRLVDPGNIVNSSGPDGGTKLLSVQRIAPIYADFTVTEQNLQDVRRSMKSGALKVQVWVPSDAKEIRDGELTFLDNAVQSGSGTVQLRATLPNKDTQFWPGQFVQVRLIQMILKDAVLVPATAPQIGQTGPYVFVVKADSTAEQRPVTLGQRQGEMIVVANGVSAGERVITTGQMMVMPGAKVNVTDSAAPPAAAQQTAGAR